LLLLNIINAPHHLTSFFFLCFFFYSFLFFRPIYVYAVDNYQWQDKNGVTHFTDNIDSVPESVLKKYLQKKEKSEKKKKGKKNHRLKKRNVNKTNSYNSQKIRPKKGDWLNSYVEGKRKWQKLVQFWVKEKQSITQKILIANQRTASLRKKYLVKKRILDRQNYLNALKDLKGLKERLRQVDKILQEDIPNQAQKKGIPPGWLRQ